MGDHELFQLLGLFRNAILGFQVAVIERHRKIAQVDQRHVSAGLRGRCGGNLHKLLVVRVGAGAARKGKDLRHGRHESSLEATDSLERRPDPLRTMRIEVWTMANQSSEPRNPFYLLLLAVSL